MKVNYYSVYKKNAEFTPSVLTSFADKEKAELHAKLLNKSGGEWGVIPSELTLFLPKQD